MSEKVEDWLREGTVSQLLEGTVSQLLEGAEEAGNVDVKDADDDGGRESAVELG